jgi:hypothetical protein
MEYNGACIGMFGTCGKSTFRKEIFIPRYLKEGLVEGVDFYNPQVESWDPSCAKVEALHLSKDQVILFPVTSETYAVGSLAEVGFSILNAIKLDDRRDIIIMIHEHLDDELMVDKDRSKESLRARQLVLVHLAKQRLNNVFLVKTFEEMLEMSLVCLRHKKEMVDYVSRFSVRNLDN